MSGVTADFGRPKGLPGITAGTESDAEVVMQPVGRLVRWLGALLPRRLGSTQKHRALSGA